MYVCDGFVVNDSINADDITPPAPPEETASNELSESRQALNMTTSARDARCCSEYSFCVVIIVVCDGNASGDDGAYDDPRVGDGDGDGDGMRDESSDGRKEASDGDEDDDDDGDRKEDARLPRLLSSW